MGGANTETNEPHLRSAQESKFYLIDVFLKIVELVFKIVLVYLFRYLYLAFYRLLS